VQKKHGQGLSAHNYCKDHRTNNFLNSISRYRIFVVMDNCMSVDRRISLSVIRSAGMIAVITVDSTWKKDLLHTQSPYTNCETVESFAISFKRGLASCASVHERGRLSLGEFHNWPEISFPGYSISSCESNHIFDIRTAAALVL